MQPPISPTIPALTPEQAIELIRNYGEVVSGNAFNDRDPDGERRAAQRLFQALTGRVATSEQIDQIYG